jgi:hypothetical protein
VKEMVDVTTGMAFLTGLGLPEILLWVLAFAITFGILVELKIFKRAPSALISIVIGFFVLMAAPAAAIAVIATMSTSLVLVAVGLLVLMTLLVAGGVGNFYFNKMSWLAGLVIIAIVALVFIGSGGLALIGISLPTLAWLGSIPWILVVVGVAVLWMIYESREQPKVEAKPAAQTK